MSEEKVQVVNPIAPIQAAAGKEESVDANTLVQIMLRREARLAQKEEAELAAAAQKAKQRKKNAESHFEDANMLMAKCKHLKGGKNRVRAGALKDYAVYIHTYINAERVIKCFLCPAKWKQQDTKEFLVRGGKKLPNPTGIGWNEALLMLGDSTNQASSSEIPLRNATPAVDQVEI